MLAPGVTAAMVAMEFTEVTLSTITKAAMSQGMSQFVFIVYSNVLACFILLPSSFIYYRKRARPPLTVLIICKFFLVGLVCCCLQLSMAIGLKYSSPTLSFALIDLTPAFTFLLAVVCRMEKVDLRARSSQAKSIGTLLSISGALTVTLYQGLPITSEKMHIDNLYNHLLLPVQSNWIIGGIFCGAGAIFLALLYIVQTWTIKEYPEVMMITLFSTFFVTILSAIVSAIVEKDSNVWRLKPDMKLIAIVSSGIFAVSLRTIVHTWACRIKGPVYTSMFKPLGMVIAMVMGVSFLGDTLYLGSVIGAVIIAFGFYAVIWGKAQEESNPEDKNSSSFESASAKTPLLLNRSV